LLFVGGRRARRRHGERRHCLDEFTDERRHSLLTIVPWEQSAVLLSRY
jgi:hypothetical protein